MRKPQYISPSALKIFLDDPEDYYLKYLSDARPDRFPQTRPMSAGSAADAYIKSYLHQTLTGRKEPKYDLTALFEAQVEPHNRDWAWPVGHYIFGAYKDSGALADLMFEFEGAASEPRFEFEVRGTIGGRREGMSGVIERVPLLGKPDVYFINRHGAHVILDWKVNGFCSKGNVSPTAGYKLLRDCHLPSRNHLMSHKDYIPFNFKGVEVDGGSYLEQRNAEWATQLCSYCWILGEPVGAEVVTAIDQICCKASGIEGVYPTLRIAHHRSRVSRGFQLAALANYQELWHRIEHGHFFRELSREESDARCGQIEARAAIEYGDSDNDQWFKNAVANPPRTYFGKSVT